MKLGLQSEHTQHDAAFLQQLLGIYTRREPMNTLSSLL